MTSPLLDKARALPETPGVYLFKDEKGRVLYVGKAKRLRDRVCSYFRPARPPDPKTDALVPQVADIEVLETKSEVDALLLEARLIKDIQPKYNSDLKDDKSYPSLEIADGDDYPGVYYTRDLSHGNSVYYGPFTDAGGLDAAITLLQGVFRFRTCRLDIRADDPKKRFFHPCLLWHIKKCTAPCADRISQTAYRDGTRELKRFLKGDREGLIKRLEARMARAASRLDFETAARVRDELAALESLDRRASAKFAVREGLHPVDPAAAMRDLAAVFHLADPVRILEGVDIANLQGESAVGALVTFVDGVPFKPGYRRYRIQAVTGPDDYRMIREVVARRYRPGRAEEMPAPDVLLIDGGKGHLAAALAELDAAGTRPRVVAALAKEEEVLFAAGADSPITLPRNSPALRVLQHVRDEAHRFAQAYHHLLRKKQIRKGAES
ncbi:MAG: excinuclease ABC subunit UvrC [Planctomycetota bacterium]